MKFYEEFKFNDTDEVDLLDEQTKESIRHIVAECFDTELFTFIPVELLLKDCDQKVVDAAQEYFDDLIVLGPERFYAEFADDLLISDYE